MTNLRIITLFIMIWGYINMFIYLMSLLGMILLIIVFYSGGFLGSKYVVAVDPEEEQIKLNLAEGNKQATSYDDIVIRIGDFVRKGIIAANNKKELSIAPANDDNLMSKFTNVNESNNENDGQSFLKLNDQTGVSQDSVQTASFLSNYDKSQNNN